MGKVDTYYSGAKYRHPLDLPLNDLPPLLYLPTSIPDNQRHRKPDNGPAIYASRTDAY